MNRAADLLIKQNIACKFVNAEVGADGEFTQIACAVVGVELRLQEFIVLFGAGFHNFAVFEVEFDAGSCASADNRRI